MDLLRQSITASHSADLEVQQVQLSTVYAKRIYMIDAANATAATFKVGHSGNSSSINQVEISIKAVGKTVQEMNLQNFPGRSLGESLESKLKTIFPVSTELEISGVNDRQWLVTFLNAPWNLPSLDVISGNVSLKTIVESNRIYGDFTLTYQGKTTLPIQHNASALSVKSRLELLDTVQAVSVHRYGPDLNDGYSWLVTFFAPSRRDLRLMNVNSGGLKTTCVRKTTLGKQCVFPFVYEGQHYYDCIPIDSPKRYSSWCPTSVDTEDGLTFKSKVHEWGHCSFLDCDMAKAHVTQVREGVGRPEVHRIDTFASHIDQIQTITINASCSNCTLEGDFKLKLDLNALDILGGDENSDGFWDGDLSIVDGENKVLNGNFTESLMNEAGAYQPKFWKRSSQWVESDKTDKEGKSHVLKIQQFVLTDRSPTGPQDGGGFDPIQVYQQISTIEGRTYSISYDVFVDESANTDKELYHGQVLVQDGVYQKGHSGFETLYPAQRMKWHTVSTMFVAQSSTTTIVLSAESSSLAVAAYFANVRVFESTNIPTGYCFADPPRPNTLDGCPSVSTTEPINIFAWTCA